MHYVFVTESQTVTRSESPLDTCQMLPGQFKFKLDLLLCTGFDFLCLSFAQRPMNDREIERNRCDERGLGIPSPSNKICRQWFVMTVMA